VTHPFARLTTIVALLPFLSACEPQVEPTALDDTAPQFNAVGPHGGGPPASVVFYSGRDGNLEIYAMNADGSGVTNLTDHPLEDVWPDLSRDGRHVAFASTRAGNREIFVLDLRSGELVNVSNSPTDDNWPRWSPNGRQIAFHSNRDGNYEIYVVNVDGSGIHRVTNNPLLDQWPEWSPTGERLAFRRDMDIFVIDAAGEEQNPQRLTFLPATIDQMPAWSPNGKQIAFMSTRDGYCSVFLMDVTGDTPGNPAVNLTPKAASDTNAQWCSRAPAWSSNGQRIFFTSFRPSTGGSGVLFFDLFSMDRDGGNLQQLTSARGEDGGPRMR
jgi:Tol biopolymer transport system component